METFKTKEYFIMDDHEFDQLVERLLGFEYEAVASNEWNNYSNYSADNVKKIDMESEFNKKYWIPDVEKSIAEKKEIKPLSYHQLLAYMVYKDLIPEGNYLIKSYW